MFQTQITIAAFTVFPLFSIGQLSENVKMENVSQFSPGDNIALDPEIGFTYMVVLKKSQILQKKTQNDLVLNQTFLPKRCFALNMTF